MPDPTEKKPVNRPRYSLTGNQKMFITCFGMWCASSVAHAAICLKALDKQIALETIKATANKSL